MQIILRRASTLEKACDQAIAELKKFDSILRLSVTQLPIRSADLVRDRLREESQNAMDRIAQIHELLEAKLEIRNLAGRKNAEVGIDDINREEQKLLNVEEEWLNALIRDLTGPGKSDAYMSARGLSSGVIRSRHNADDVVRGLETVQLRLQTVTNGNVSDYVEVSVLSEEQIKPLKDRIMAIRRRRQALNDHRAELNLKNTIDLPDRVVHVLNKHQLLDETAGRD